MEDYNKIYPQLPEEGESFRLQSVSKYFSELEAGLSLRKRPSKNIRSYSKP